MAGLEHTVRNKNDFIQTTTRASANNMYISIDQKAESLTSKPNDFGTPHLLPVYADCSGELGLPNCPPYHANNIALACVVGSK